MTMLNYQCVSAPFHPLKCYSNLPCDCMKTNREYFCFCAHSHFIHLQALKVPIVSRVFWDTKHQRESMTALLELIGFIQL